MMLPTLSIEQFKEVQVIIPIKIVDYLLACKGTIPVHRIRYYLNRFLLPIEVYYEDRPENEYYGRWRLANKVRL